MAVSKFLVLWILKADLDHLAKEDGLAHRASAKPCALCPANSSQNTGLTYNNFKSTAAWMTRSFTPVVWKRRHPDGHNVFQMRYLSTCNVEPDELHVMCGSVMWHPCHDVLGGSLEANMNDVWNGRVRFYRTHRV